MVEMFMIIITTITTILMKQLSQEKLQNKQEYIQQLDNNNNMNNNPSYANKFIISDTRDRPTQILLKNPCDFSIVVLPMLELVIKKINLIKKLQNILYLHIRNVYLHQWMDINIDLNFIVLNHPIHVTRCICSSKFTIWFAI